MTPRGLPGENPMVPRRAQQAYCDQCQGINGAMREAKTSQGLHNVSMLQEPDFYADLRKYPYTHANYPNYVSNNVDYRAAACIAQAVSRYWQLIKSEQFPLSIQGELEWGTDWSVMDERIAQGEPGAVPDAAGPRPEGRPPPPPPGPPPPEPARGGPARSRSSPPVKAPPARKPEDSARNHPQAVQLYGQLLSLFGQEGTDLVLAGRIPQQQLDEFREGTRHILLTDLIHGGFFVFDAPQDPDLLGRLLNIGRAQCAEQGPVAIAVAHTADPARKGALLWAVSSLRRLAPADDPLPCYLQPAGEVWRTGVFPSPGGIDETLFI